MTRPKLDAEEEILLALIHNRQKEIRKLKGSIKKLEELTSPQLPPLDESGFLQARFYMTVPMGMYTDYGKVRNIPEAEELAKKKGLKGVRVKWPKQRKEGDDE